ncbi:MAG: pectinesterase family protein [Spirosomataceae bacterium]
MPEICPFIHHSLGSLSHYKNHSKPRVGGEIFLDAPMQSSFIVRLICSILVGIFCLTHFTIHAQNYPTRLVVSQDGKGDYRTIQEAVNAVRDHTQVPVQIVIKAGVYAEKLVIPSWKPSVHLIGEDRNHVVITGADYTGLAHPDAYRDPTGRETFHTYTTHTVLVDAPFVILENLTIQNTAGRVGQAVALHVEADHFIAKNCSIFGNQDTLFAAREGTRQYYENCTITGTTDFIFGKAIAVFQSCVIHSLSNSYITAAATPKGQKAGFVFLDCMLTADQAVTKVYLGRPWRPYAQTVFIRTNMGAHILPEGWDNWRNKANEKTAFYAEFGSFGQGGDISKRAQWSKQLTRTEAKKSTIETIFGKH